MKPLTRKTAIALAVTSALSGLLSAVRAAEPTMAIRFVEDQQVEESFFDAYLLPAANKALSTESNRWVSGYSCTGCPSGCDACVPPGAMAPSAPGEPTPGQPAEPFAPSTVTPMPSAPTADFSGQFQGGTLLASRDVPAMFGDFFGAGGSTIYVFDDSFPIPVVIPDPAVGGANVGRQKLAENTSPVPRDRVFLNYSHFHNTPLIEGGLSIDRFTPGFEKTFFDDMMSIELRIPVAITLDNDVTVSNIPLQPPAFPAHVQGTNLDSGQLGNITLFLKGVLFENESCLLSTGLGVAVPTAEDFRVIAGAFPPGDIDSGDVLFQVDNNAVHLLPFIGGVYAPNDRLYSTFLLQIDVDANGNRVRNVFFGGDPLEPIGTIQDRTYLFLDASVGYWLFHNPSSGHGLTGLAPVFEVHYNQSLTDTDTLNQPFFGDPVIVDQGDLSLVNFMLGLNAEFGDDIYVQAGYALPVAGNEDEQFDGEFRLLFNWLFGRSNSRVRQAPTFR